MMGIYACASSPFRTSAVIPNSMSLKPLVPLPWCYSLAVMMTGVDP